MIEVNEAHMNVAYSEDCTSAYALFSLWPDDTKFVSVYQFYFDSPHTADDLLGKCVDVFGIIRDMLYTAKLDFYWATNAGHITGEDKTTAGKILDDINQHLNTAIARYNESSREQFIHAPSELFKKAPSASLLALPHALAQLKALSAPCEGCDYNCACGACKTCVGATDVIRRKKQAGCRCRACAERSTTRTAP